MVEHIGGQAVIEGVMIRKGNKVATAVRLPNKKIKIKKDIIKKKRKLWKIPFMRGIASLQETLVIGMKTLIWSADQQTGKHEKITKTEVIATLIVSFAFAIFLFIGVPFIIAKIFFDKGTIFHVFDGIFRIGVFIAYLIVISFSKDVKRLFQYHGAEHKVVNCYESKKALTFKNIKKFSTIHTRCGTSFIFIVLIISILIFSIFSADKWYYNLGIRIIFIPIIVSISYEVLRLGAKHNKNPIMKLLSLPGALLQKISTKEPDKKQVEIALAALKAVK